MESPLFYDMNSILLYIAGYNFVFGTYVLFKNFFARQNKAFAIVCFGLSMWASGLYFLQRTHSFYWWDKLTLLGGFLTIAGFYWFSSIFPGNIKKRIWPFILPLLVLILLLPFNFYIKSDTFVGNNYYPVNGFLYPLMAFAYLFYIFEIFHNGYLQFKSNNAYSRQRLIYIFFGLAIFLLTALLCDVLLPAFGFSYLKYLGPISSLFFILSCVVSIVSYRLMDIRLLARSIIVNGLSIFVSAFVFVVVTHLRDFDFESPIMLLIFIADIIVFISAKFALSNIYEKLFLKAYLKFNASLNELNLNLISLLKPAEIIDLAKNFLKNSLILTWVYYYDFSKQKFDIDAVDKKELYNFPLNGLFSAEFKDMALSSQSPIFFQGINFESLTNFETPIGLMPLYEHSRFCGYFLLGPSLNLNGLSADEEAHVKTAWAHIQTAYARAFLYESMENKIQAQVKDIMYKNQKLGELVEERMDFLQAAAHQLRTPTAVISSSLELIQKRILAKEQHLEIADIAYEKAKGLTNLVNGILDLAKLEKGKLSSEFGNPVNLNEIFKNIMPVLRPGIENKQLSLGYNPLPESVRALGNSDYLEQVFFNILENAVHNTDSGGIKVYFKVDDHLIITCIEDTGIGIEEGSSDNIFQKNVRGKNSKGVGLGLYIAKMIVKAHKKGHIWFESGSSGTTFYVRLKRFKPKEIF